MFVALTLWLGLLVPFAQNGGCKVCKFRGVLDCDKHVKEMKAFEAEVQFCSVTAECASCGGSFLVKCGKCDSGPDVAGMEKRRAEIAQWMKADPLKAHVGHSVPRVETERFQIVVDTPALKEGKKLIEPHVIIHRVAHDVEAVSALVTLHYGIGPKDYFAKMRMWIWGNPEDHKKVMTEVLHSTSTGDFKLLGRDPVFSVWMNPPNFNDVPKVRAVFAHNAPHMLLSNLHDQMWVGDIGGGWFDAGLGHWYEYQLFGKTINYCIEESEAPPNYFNGRWRAPIRARVESESGRLLVGLFGKSTGNLGAAEHALCWSFYDWLVAEYPKNLDAILKGLKKKQPIEELFRAQLGMGIFGAESAWRNWVKKTYPKEGDTPLK